MEPLLTTTSDERPPCLWRTLTYVQTALLFRRNLFHSHLSTPYYGHISGCPSIQNDLMLWPAPPIFVMTCFHKDCFFADLGFQEDPDEEEGQFDLDPRITRFQEDISSLEVVHSWIYSREGNKDCTNELHSTALTLLGRAYSKNFFILLKFVRKGICVCVCV